MAQPRSLGKNGRLFLNNITLRGGAAPARAYIPELLPYRLANSTPLLFSI
ncbi:hypothetical protein [Nostoc sp. CALU 1950]